MDQIRVPAKQEISALKNPPAPLLVQLAPVIFVLLWATGFVGAKFGTDDADPFTFLGIRFAITTALLALIVAFWVKPGRLDRRQLGHSMIVGCLIHGAYLGGVFYAVDRGLGAGISSLVVALQPFFTAIFARLILGERLSLAQRICFVVALLGVFLVLFPDLDLSNSLPGISPETLTACFIGTVGISIGAVYQKRTVTTLNLWAATAGQFAGAAVLMAVLSFAFETGGISWTVKTILTMAWLVLVLSIGAVVLLMFLIRQGDSASVASLFFLVPVIAMFATWILFGDKLVTVQMLGSAIVVLSVAYASRIKENAPA